MCSQLTLDEYGFKQRKSNVLRQDVRRKLPVTLPAIDLFCDESLSEKQVNYTDSCFERALRSVKSPAGSQDALHEVIETRLKNIGEKLEQEDFESIQREQVIVRNLVQVASCSYSSDFCHSARVASAKLALKKKIHKTSLRNVRAAIATLGQTRTAWAKDVDLWLYNGLHMR